MTSILERGDRSRISLGSISYKDFIPVAVVMGISRICRGNDAAHIAKRHWFTEDTDDRVIIKTELAIRERQLMKGKKLSLQSFRLSL